jgi:serine/threonine protein kinase
MEHISPDNPRTKFELLELLGEGSYGTVHKAKIRADGTVCAVKILSMEGAENEDELQNELEILRKCVHESIVSYFGSYREAGDLWIAMEYCGTGSVRDLLDALKYYTDTDNEEGIVLDEEQIAAILVGTLRGLEYLHNSKMIHRDIKSGNVLLTEGGGCKLADFGVSAQLQKTLSKRKTLIGSPYWMAPEVIREEAYDGRADIWSVGIIAIEMAQNVCCCHSASVYETLCSYSFAFVAGTTPPRHPPDACDIHGDEKPTAKAD